MAALEMGLDGGAAAQRFKRKSVRYDGWIIAEMCFFRKQHLISSSAQKHCCKGRVGLDLCQQPLLQHK